MSDEANYLIYCTILRKISLMVYSRLIDFITCKSIEVLVFTTYICRFQFALGRRVRQWDWFCTRNRVFSQLDEHRGRNVSLIHVGSTDYQHKALATYRLISSTIAFAIVVKCGMPRVNDRANCNRDRAQGRVNFAGESAWNSRAGCVRDHKSARAIREYDRESCDHIPSASWLSFMGSAFDVYREAGVSLSLSLPELHLRSGRRDARRRAVCARGMIYGAG